MNNPVIKNEKEQQDEEANTTAPIDEEEQIRFQVELEFVQMLANPFYLQHLAQYKYFEDKSFISYLKYLLYWKQPEYSKFIMYPNCLYYLDRLQDEGFRSECAKAGFSQFLMDQQRRHWMYYRSNREKEAMEA